MIFEGRDSAGKGGVIKRITQRLNPRVCRVVALPAPNERERSQWYFQRYISHLPAAGEIVLFDRSWYNRAGVEHVMGFCTDEEYDEFFRTVPEFERMLVRSGIIVIKYWFSISDEEQEFRFNMRINDPLKQWKLSPMDIEARRRWEDYTKAKEVMLAQARTSPKRRGGSSKPTTSAARGLTPSRICCRKFPMATSSAKVRAFPNASGTRIITASRCPTKCTCRNVIEQIAEIPHLMSQPPCLALVARLGPVGGTVEEIGGGGRLPREFFA